MKKCRYILLVLLLLTSCVVDGQGWRLDVRSGGFTLDFTVKPNSVGEYYYENSFDPKVWRSFTEWWEDKDEAERGRIKKDVDLILRWLRETDDEYDTVRRLHDLVIEYEGTETSEVVVSDYDNMQPVDP